MGWRQHQAGLEWGGREGAAAVSGDCEAVRFPARAGLDMLLVGGHPRDQHPPSLRAAAKSPTPSWVGHRPARGDHILCPRSRETEAQTGETDLRAHAKAPTVPATHACSDGPSASTDST